LLPRASLRYEATFTGANQLSKNIVVTYQPHLSRYKHHGP
jgi:hypothetical protein